MAQYMLLLHTNPKFYSDNEVQFYEVANFEPYCQLCDLESTPLKVDFWSDPKNINSCIMVIGDEQVQLQKIIKQLLYLVYREQ